LTVMEIHRKYFSRGSIRLVTRPHEKKERPRDSSARRPRHAALFVSVGIRYARAPLRIHQTISCPPSRELTLKQLTTVGTLSR
jgi:hypothetical protein